MKTLLFFLATTLTFTLGAQEGILDTSFGNNGYVITDFFEGSDRGSCIAVQEDGKIVVFGVVNLSSGFSYGLVRYLPDGQLDTSFGTDGFVIVPGGENYYEYHNSIHILDDQKIMVSTTFQDVDNADFMLMRFMPNGEPDLSFGVNGSVKTDYDFDKLASTNLLADNKVMAGGKTTTNSTENHILLARYLSDGQLDPSFGSGGTLVDFVNNETLKVFDIQTREDGKILVLYFTIENFEKKIKLNQYLPDGTLDTAFGVNGVVEAVISSETFYGSLMIQTDGKIIYSYKGQATSVVKLTRLLVEGTLDNTFASGGILDIHNDRFIALKTLEDENNNILVFGPTFFFEPDVNIIYRFRSDGFIDSTFGTNGSIELGFEGADIAFQPDGKLVVAGNTFFYNGGEDYAVARILNGTLSVPQFDSSELTIYPNPSNGIFYIKSQLISEKTPYQITDITGKIIAKGELNDTQSSIDLATVQSGVYFLNTSNRVFRLLKN